jgi:hypothetical protein
MTQQYWRYDGTQRFYRHRYFAELYLGGRIPITQRYLARRTNYEESLNRLIPTVLPNQIRLFFNAPSKPGGLSPERIISTR